MYYPYFVTYMIMGIVISLGVFYWAVKTGQFREQQRARFLPLKDLPAVQDDKPPMAGRYEVYALWAVALVGLILTALVLIRALILH